MSTQESVVRLSQVTKRFGQSVAVDQLNLDISEGSFFSLLGPSGCGKTTSLRMIAGFETPDEGDVFIRGQNVTRIVPHKRDFAMVFQNFALFPHMSVAENVAFGLKMTGVGKAEREQRAREALAMVRLPQFADRYPKQLSGGQQQRVAIARAIVMRPAVLLLDEPLGALDKNLREEMQVELRSLQQDLGIATVFVTHDQEEALTLSDTIAVMRDGRIEQRGSPADVYERPVNRFVATFLGASNLLRGRILGTGKTARIDAGGIAIPLGEATGHDGDEIEIAIRPERMSVQPQGAAGIPAVIKAIVYKGATVSLYCDASGDERVVFVPGGHPSLTGLKTGASIVLSFDPAHAVPLQSE
jgi:putative spermidine/putrescine transport system ATP-binding protein/spermidine/putrescine transport system ATP-binding protein